MTGFHEGKKLEEPGTTCPGSVQADKKKPALVCDCWCHKH